MPDNGDELVFRMHREAIQRFRDEPLPEVKRPTIPYTQLPEAKPDDVFFLEWNLYRREVGRWLTDGHEGKFVLIKGESVIGLYDTWAEARKEGRKRYGMDPFLVQPIQPEETVYRIRGYS